MQNQLKQIYFIVRFGNGRYVSMKVVTEIQKTILNKFITPSGIKDISMNTNSYLRIENGYDISKITGVIPQNIGEGFQFDLSDKTYTTMGSYTKDKKRLMNIEISSFCGLCGGAIHYYAKLYIKVSNVCGNSSVSGYLGGIEIPNEYQTIKGEFVRPLTQKEIDKQPDRWGYWYQVGDLVNAFESLQEIESLIKNLKKKFSSKEWKVEIIRNY